MSSIGRYEVQKEIGRGAMGVVYLARDPQLQREVAVKTYLLPDGISEEVAKEFHARFLREARAAASLSHPGIVTIHDAGEDQSSGLPYIAMEFVPGESLKQRLDKGKSLDPSWVLSIGGVLAEALHLAHRAGIIHRDIKPANILIRESDGAAKIADFGVAKLTSSDLTQSGSSIGSPGYMSPEQVRGGTLDGRSDLFSLAVVLYEALCGKRPFHGEDLVSLAYSIAHDTQIPLSRQFRNCPVGLDRFFDKALSKDPGQRFADGAAFREALLSAGNEKPSPIAGIDKTRIEVPPAAGQAQASTVGLNGKTIPLAAAGVAEARHKRILAPAIAIAVLLLVGVAAAAYLKLGHPQSASAESRAAAGFPFSAVDGNSSADKLSARSERSTPPETAEHLSPEAQKMSGAHPAMISPTQHSASPAAPKPMIPKVHLTVPAGTEIHLALNAPISSSSSQAGDSFTARVAEPVVSGERVAIPAGSTLKGHVVQAVPAKKGLSNKAGSLSLAFDKIVTPSGISAPVSATFTSVGRKSTGKTAGIIGGSAAGGALLGKMFGGKTKDAAVGSLAGAALGTGIAAGTKGQDVEFASGSSLTIKLDQPLTIEAKQ